MRQAVLFDQFAETCPFANNDTEVNGGYGCNHPDCENTEYDEENKKKVGCCYCHCCPLGIEAEQEDLTDPEHPDAIQDELDWDGLCTDGEVEEGEILLVVADEDATGDQKQALLDYERYMHRYDPEWLEKNQTFDELLKNKEQKRKEERN